MTHVPNHPDPNQHCPKCVIDDGRLAAAARLFSRRTKDEEASAEALHLADVAEAVGRATECAFRLNLIDEKTGDELHAMSELSCHRAAMLRGWARGISMAGGWSPAILAKWADELATHTTALLGGEYHGAFEVVGTEGIRKRE